MKLAFISDVDSSYFESSEQSRHRSGILVLVAHVVGPDVFSDLGLEPRLVTKPHRVGRDVVDLKISLLQSHQARLLLPLLVGIDLE